MSTIINKKSAVNTGLIVMAVLLGLLPLLSFGQSAIAPTPYTNIDQIAGGGGLLETIMNWMFSIFLFIAVIMILWAAFMYITARGDPDKTGDARKAFIWAIVAIVIAVIARGVPTIVGNFLGAPGVVV